MIIKHQVDLDNNQVLNIFIDIYNRQIHDVSSINATDELIFIMCVISHINIDKAILCLDCNHDKSKYSQEIIDILRSY